MRLGSVLTQAGVEAGRHPTFPTGMPIDEMWASP